MATKKPSMFGAEAAKRQLEQEALEAKLTNKTPAAQEADDNKIIRMNISITESYRQRLMAYAKKKCLPASAIIRMWIDEHCD